MHTSIPERLLEISDEIAEQGNAQLTRLTVLKKWFERPSRLSAFGIWLAALASSSKGKSAGTAGNLLKAGRVLLGKVNLPTPEVDRNAAKQLHEQLRDFQNQYRHQQWGPVRMVKNWNVMLVEHGLAIYLWHSNSPAHGYKLAADYCQHYDSRYGSGLNGPSRRKIKDIVGFMLIIEALEDDHP